jgi:hypothetical protein
MLLGFKKRFEQPILNGTKVLTMRFPRKHPAKIGERLHMYSGLRTPACKLIANHHKIVSIQSVRLSIITEATSGKEIIVFIDVDGKRMLGYSFLKLITADGFNSSNEFIEYWLDGKEKITVNLNLYHWTDLRF